MSSLDRRDFVKRLAVASAATAASALMPGVVFGDGRSSFPDRSSDLVWKKAPCRFCGVGCGLLIGIQNARAVAVRGDPDSPVSKGLACVKGYHAVQALYGSDRLTRAQVRRNGRLVEASMGEALDLVARTLAQTVEQHGKDSVALYGSGQWTIPAGYVASKLWKGALGTNQLESDGRLGLAAAHAGLESSFGLDHPLGCYDDIEQADVFVIWGANLAETFPVLFSRILERRRRDRSVRIIDLATRTTRTSYAADRAFLVAPRSDLAIANAICQELVVRDWVHHAFLERHVAFRKAATPATGTGADLIPEEPVPVDWDEYRRFVADYTPERAQQISGMSAADIRWLASIYGNRSLKVMSLWSAGLSQHARGLWSNNLVYNIHLLTGKIGSSGNSPFALTGAPSGCGTVREVGTLTERLPGGNVTEPADRARAAAIWRVPQENIPSEPGLHAMAMFQAFDRGDLRFLWVQGSNPMGSLPNLTRYRDAAKKDRRFLVVSDVYPTATTERADVVLPSALWIEQEGLYGNAERRTQHWEQMLRPPGDAVSDAWQLIEVARRLGHAALFPWDEAGQVAGIWAEYTRFHDNPQRRRAPLAELKARPGLMWPWVEGKETRWRYNTAHDPAADPARGDFDFYGHPDHRAWIWLRPWEAPDEAPSPDYPFWLLTVRVLEHWETGALTRRIPTLHRAVPRGYVEMHRQDARDLGIRNGDHVRLVSRRGALVMPVRIDFRAQPPRGQLAAAFFDESLPVNLLTRDAWCPVSGQPEIKTCAVRIEHLSDRSDR